ncbi:MAG TPA: DUF5668 domain-containing protein, partial [Terriglobales bacterium]
VYIAGIVITAGVVLLLDQWHVFSFSLVAHFWRLLFVVVGLGKLMLPNRGEKIFGGLLVMVGVGLELNYLGYTNFGWQQMWPVIIIAVGVALLLQAVERKNYPGPSTESEFNLSNVFAGTEQRIKTKNFRGGRISAVFGGFKIDLTGADLETNEGAIEINVIFGGGEILIPETWTAVVQATAIFGAFEDKTRTFRPDPAMPVKTLYIRGSAIFGGVEIKN